MRGFSLIELLVTVAIIALLVGVLLPVLGSVRGEGRTIACGSNLRQLGIANASYAAEHDGVFAAYGQVGTHYEGWWTEVLAPYLARTLIGDAPAAGVGPDDIDESDFNVARGGGAVLRCPEDELAFPKLFGEAVGIDHVGSSEGWLSYAMNSGPVTTNSDTRRFCGVGGNTVDSLLDAGATAHHIDAAYLRYVSDVDFFILNPRLDGGFITATPDPRSHYTAPAPIGSAAHREAHRQIMGERDRVYRHGGTMNVLFADGHVARRGLLPGAAEQPAFWGPVYTEAE